MANNVFTSKGGHVQYIPDKVQSTIDPYQYSDEDQIRQLALQRDLTAANLLENDILLDMLDAAIDDQMKNFALTSPALAKSAQNLCGSPTITWECYKKAKELLNIAPWIANGFDPVQLTFTDTFQPRAGNVVFNCQNFDPNTFQDISSNVDAALNNGDGTNGESPNAIQARAQENQKQWALLMLFWDLLWGKPVVKPGIPDDVAKQKTIDQIQTEIDNLKKTAANLQSEGKAIQAITTSTDADLLKATNDLKTATTDLSQADQLASSLAKSENLPNTIMLDRPRNVSQLQWQGKTAVIQYVLNAQQTGVDAQGHPVLTQFDTLHVDPVNDPDPWVSSAMAVWVDFGSLLFSDTDVYKDKSIPAISSGFILAILIGFLSLVPKIAFFFIKIRKGFLHEISWMHTKRFFGIKLFNPVYIFFKVLISSITAVVAVFNTIFLEICIWLSLMPWTYIPNVSDNANTQVPNTVSMVKTSMDVQPTPAGFISMDCFTAAQDIVNGVHQVVTNA